MGLGNQQAPDTGEKTPAPGKLLCKGSWVPCSSFPPLSLGPLLRQWVHTTPPVPRRLTELHGWGHSPVHAVQRPTLRAWDLLLQADPSALPSTAHQPGSASRPCGLHRAGKRGLGEALPAVTRGRAGPIQGLDFLVRTRERLLVPGCVQCAGMLPSSCFPSSCPCRLASGARAIFVIWENPRRREVDGRRAT